MLRGMKTEKSKATELKAQLAAARTGDKGLYPAPLRAQAIAYSLERIKHGASAREVAAELGIKECAVAYWRSTHASKRASRKPAFKAVHVVEAAPATTGVVVHARQGIRIEGLSFDDIALLLSRLG
jgi:hypothetical protein